MDWIVLVIVGSIALTFLMLGWKKAEERGYQKGYGDGYQDGDLDKDSAYQKGYGEGLKEGYDKGYHDGSRQSHDRISTPERGRGGKRSKYNTIL